MTNSYHYATSILSILHNYWYILTQSVNNGYNRSKYHATKTNSFEVVLFFNKVSYCVVFFVCFKFFAIQWLITPQGFHYWMTWLPD